MSPKRQSRDKPVRVAGRYALFDRIASGGMASVHLGRQLGDAGFARTVAIKRMRRGLVDDPRLITMFVDEARLAGRVQHPNVVATIDVVSDHGELFLVMEYVHGASLKSLTNIAGKVVSPPPEISAAIATGALRGLHAAHEAKGEGGAPLGIVHRDVSPQNLLVSADGTTRVVDFGVAKAAGRLQRTETGQLKGKPRYMAPEQLTDKRDHPVDRRTDIFSMATVLWELLAGRRLFDDMDDLEVLRKILSMPIASPREHDDRVPTALAGAVLKGLDRTPGLRHDTARDFARAIEAAMPRGIASQEAVGEWVLSIAGERLAEVERRILEIEGAAPSDADDWKARDMVGAASEPALGVDPPTVKGAAAAATATVPDLATEGTETNVDARDLFDREESCPDDETKLKDDCHPRRQKTIEIDPKPQPNSDDDVVDLSGSHQDEEDNEGANDITRKMEPRKHPPGLAPEPADATQTDESAPSVDRSSSPQPSAMTRDPSPEAAEVPSDASRTRNIALLSALAGFVVSLLILLAARC